MTERPLKRMEDSRQYLAEIVGEESLHGQRMQAGAILDLMDMVAGRTAAAHAGGPVVTLSFDRVDLAHPIAHQDLVRLEAQVVNVGRTSIMLGVDVYRQDFLAREYIPIQRSFVTLVGIDAQRRPNPDIPGLAITSEAERALHEEAVAQKALAAEWLRMQKAVQRSERLTVAEVEEALNREKREKLAPAQTVVRVRRQFMPRHANVLGTIFGGDILLWMDRVATYTARQFTRNRHMITLAMNRIFFKQPIYASDLVEMTARVVYVRRFTLEVEVEVTLQRAGGQAVPSHSGYFIILNYDESGFKRPILTGLALSDADQDDLRRYLSARERHHFWETHKPALRPRPE